MSVRSELPLALAVVGLVPGVYASPVPASHATTVAAAMVAAVVIATGSQLTGVLGAVAVAAFALLHHREVPRGNALPA